MKLCSFGCGKPAVTRFKTTGNYCCSFNPGGCEVIKEKNKNSQPFFNKSNLKHSKFMMGDGNPNFGKRGEQTSQFGRLAENAPNWTGGCTYYWSLELKKVYKDCSLCHSDYKIEMHHRNENRDINERENLIILCKLCHDFWHKN